MVDPFVNAGRRFHTTTPATDIFIQRHYTTFHFAHERLATVVTYLCYYIIRNIGQWKKKNESWNNNTLDFVLVFVLKEVLLKLVEYLLFIKKQRNICCIDITNGFKDFNVTF